MDDAVWSAMLLLFGALLVSAGKFLDLWFDRFKAQTASEHWERRERWKFKVEVYSRLLSALRHMRGDLELAALRGSWPEGDEKKSLQKHGYDLIEPAILARLWLPDESTEKAETLGGRLLEIRNEMGEPKAQLMRACEILREEINHWVETGRDDLRLKSGRASTPQGARTAQGNR